MAWRKKLTAHKLVDFLLASMDDANPSKQSLIDLAGGEPSQADSAPAKQPATPKRRSARGKKQADADADVEMEDADGTDGKDDEDAATDAAAPPTPPTAAQMALPETEAYSHLLVLLFLLDANDPECKAASVAALNRLSQSVILLKPSKYLVRLGDTRDRFQSWR